MLLAFLEALLDYADLAPTQTALSSHSSTTSA